jgi:hypothetical protein
MESAIATIQSICVQKFIIQVFGLRVLEKGRIYHKISNFLVAHGAWLLLVHTPPYGAYPRMMPFK